MTLKPPPDRLYGRQRTHALRPRQRLLLDVTLPRLRYTPGHRFPPPAERLWLEVGFGGGEHARALIAAHPEAALIACEVFEQGLCSMLAALVPEGGEASAPLPGNLAIWDDDARILLAALPEASLDRLFLMFPDPWPKARTPSAVSSTRRRSTSSPAASSRAPNGASPATTPPTRPGS